LVHRFLVHLKGVADLYFVHLREGVLADDWISGYETVDFVVVFGLLETSEDSVWLVFVDVPSKIDHVGLKGDELFLY
jgi:hypothetical protein